MLYFLQGYRKNKENENQLTWSTRKSNLKIILLSSVVDPYNFDLNPDPPIRIGEKRIRIWPRKNLNQKYNTQTYDFLNSFISLLFIYINHKSDLFLKIIWYSNNFGCRHNDIPTYFWNYTNLEKGENDMYSKIFGKIYIF